MNNINRQNFMEQWLAQETPLTDEQYLAYRRRVSDGIRKVQKEEKVVRIVTKIAWALTALVFLAGAVVDFNRETFPEMLRLWLIAATALCMAGAGVLLAFYLINYRPRLKQAEQDSMLLSLQRQLHELRSQLPQDPHPPIPERSSNAS